MNSNAQDPEEKEAMLREIMHLHKVNRADAEAIYVSMQREIDEYEIMYGKPWGTRKKRKHNAPSAQDPASPE